MEAKKDLQTEDDGMEEILDAFFQTSEENANEAAPEAVRLSPEDMLRKLARQPIYEGAKISTLRTCLAFLNLQSVYGSSDASVTALFRLLREQLLSAGNEMPPSRPDAKQLLTSVCLDYNKIHACPNDCILFRILQELWHGIDIADAVEPLGQQHTRIHGLLMWTMHDWPGYREASGLTTLEYNACPICGHLDVLLTWIESGLR
ncbi:hypothetical protein GOP47_0003412 [Adiantum capillus-veneris]|uniref:Uncharacterized protein n=1 Tax=Adiantum capillus-veneris TaxID=13818 RepID=A0A9D4VC72_ADICA|nr:hypothetical protein GOP47_0003412 [Adiantum capillus-veneris]